MPGGTGPAAPPLALTCGDPAGIGLEISLKAWMARHARALPPFVVVGPVEAIEACGRALSLNVPIQVVSNFADGATAFQTALPVLDVPLATEAVPGKPDSDNAATVLRSIERSVAATMLGDASGIVTNPIAKHVLHGAGFKHPGHTEFLAALAEAAVPGQPIHPVMLLASDALKVVPLTIHIPLKDVAGSISTALIVKTARIVARAMTEDFGIAAPRLAIAGLNPHAGENGSIGQEDSLIIQPAIAGLIREGLNVTGPHPADTLFHAAARKTYDVVIAMYHDQALIPIKTLAFDTGVNVTLGLPFVRTSPDHGTAFDIAGLGIADPESLIHALLLAASMAKRRAEQALAQGVS